MNFLFFECLYNIVKVHIILHMILQYIDNKNKKFVYYMY